jgi:transcriptional regulator with XRE-family HTH domain
MKDTSLSNARYYWLIDEIKRLKLQTPGKDVAKKTGFSVGSVSNLLNGKRAITENFLTTFCKAFKLDYKKAEKEIQKRAELLGSDMQELKPELIARPSRKKEVIILGKNPNQRLRPEEYAEAFGNWAGLPMYNTPITATFVETYRDENIYQPQYYLHDPRFRDCDFGAIITGDSMHSEIRHGDFVACKEVTDTRFIVFGDIYYVVASNGLETCKYVNIDPSNPDNLLLVPKNEKLSPSPLPKDMLVRLYKVRGIVRGY